MKKFSLMILLLILSGKTWGTYIISYPETLKKTNYIFFDVFKKIYAEVGITPTFERYPMARSLNEVNLGNIDADIGRNNAIERAYPALIRVDFPILHLKVYAIYREKYFKKSPTISDLKHEKVGIMLGDLLAGQFTAEFSSVEKIQTAEQLLLMLDARRVDVIIIPNIYVIKGRQKYEYTKILDDTIYHYLSPKNKKLAPELKKAMAKVMTKKVSEKIFEELSSLNIITDIIR